MKSILCLLIFAAAVSQISAKKLNVTVFYETLCPNCRYIFKQQIWPAYQDKNIQENVYIELVPFGKANYTEKPWNITCQHGPRECLGNVLDACFMARYPDNYKQVAMISCTMSEADPISVGEECAKKLGYSYKGVKECSTNKEGIALQIKHGRRTLDFKPKLAVVPTMVYDNVYNERDQKESFINFKGVIRRKLKEKGVYIKEYTDIPWNITCQHGPNECLGNVLDACFIIQDSADNYKQVAMISYTMSEGEPPTAGEVCARLGYSYRGIALQIAMGQRTLNFKPKITFIPTIVYSSVYNEKDQKESLTNFKEVVLRKLKEKDV